MKIMLDPVEMSVNGSEYNRILNIRTNLLKLYINPKTGLPQSTMNKKIVKQLKTLYNIKITKKKL